MNVGTDTDLWQQRVDSGDWKAITAEPSDCSAAQ